MVFPQDHSTNPGQPKGVKEVLREWGLWWNDLLLLCQNSKCSVEATSCCATHIMSLQPDFQAQWSLVQETIEAAGHLCIFLPKFHCELNFIEFFRGAVKKYLREHCDYSYSGLQENIPKALESVELSTICKWEHHMIWCMHAYRGGKTGKEAQKQVKQFSSWRYNSHHCVPETVARAFDKIVMALCTMPQLTRKCSSTNTNLFARCTFIKNTDSSSNTFFGATSTEMKNQLQIQQQLLVERLKLSPKYNLFLKFT